MIGEQKNLDHKNFFRVYVFVATFFGFRLGGPEKIFIFSQKDTKKFSCNFFSERVEYGILSSLIFPLDFFSLSTKRSGLSSKEEKLINSKSVLTFHL